MSNPSPPTFNYSNLSFAVTLVGNQFIFTFTIPTKPGLQLSNPIYVNAVEMTIQKDRFNPNLVALGDDKGVYTVNYLNQVPPAGSLNAFINALLALIPVPVPPVVYTLANAGAGNTLVANGAGPNFTLNSISGGTDISVTLVGNDYVIAYTGAAFTPPSPAFIASHIPDGAFDYGAGPFVGVHWDDITQTSTDVTFDGTTDEFTTVVTGDYLVCFNFMASDTQDSYVAQIMNTTTNIPYASTIPLAPAWGAQNLYCAPSDVPSPYTYNDCGAGAYISTVIHLTAGDTFALGVAPDPAFVAMFLWGDAFLFGVNGLDLNVTYCSIKRLL